MDIVLPENTHNTAKSGLLKKGLKYSCPLPSSLLLMLIADICWSDHQRLTAGHEWRTCTTRDTSLPWWVTEAASTSSGGGVAGARRWRCTARTPAPGPWWTPTWGSVAGCAARGSSRCMLCTDLDWLVINKSENYIYKVFSSAEQRSNTCKAAKWHDDMRHHKNAHYNSC